MKVTFSDFRKIVLAQSGPNVQMAEKSVSVSFLKFKPSD